MSIFKKLWNGEINMAESCIPSTPEYTQALATFVQTSKALEISLSDEQKRCYEGYQKARTDVETLIQIEAFRKGVQFGFDFKKEM